MERRFNKIKNEIIKSLEFTAQEVLDFDKNFTIIECAIGKERINMAQSIVLIYNKANPNEDFNMFFYNDKGNDIGLTSVNSEEVLNTVFHMPIDKRAAVLQELNVSEKMLHLVSKRIQEHEERETQKPEFIEKQKEIKKNYANKVLKIVETRAQEARQGFHIDFKLVTPIENLGVADRDEDDSELFLVQKIQDKISFMLTLGQEKDAAVAAYTVLVQPILQLERESRNGVLKFKETGEIDYFDDDDYDYTQDDDIYYTFVTIIPQDKAQEMFTLQMPIVTNQRDFQEEIMGLINYYIDLSVPEETISQRVIENFKLSNLTQNDVFIGKDEIEALIEYKKQHQYSTPKIKEAFDNLSTQMGIYLEKCNLTLGLARESAVNVEVNKIVNKADRNKI